MSNKTVKCIIRDAGDPSVGIFHQTWEVECPFTRNDVSEYDLEFFRSAITTLYSEFAEGRLWVEYDFELKAEAEEERRIDESR